MKPFTTALFLLAFFLSLNVIAQAQMSKVVAIQQAGPLISSGTTIQQFPAIIDADKLDLNKPLTLSITNGADGHARFAWLRVFLADGSANQNPAAPRGRMIANEQCFARSTTAAVEMNGRLRQGKNYLLIIGAGMPGAAVGWTLTTVEGLSVTSIEPNVAQASTQIRVKGTNFNTAVKDTAVYLTRKFHSPQPCRLVSTTDNTIVAVVPSDVESEQYEVQVVQNGIKSNVLKVQGGGVPELTQISPSGGPAGTEFRIIGKNFSRNPFENLVTMQLSENEDTTLVAPVTEATEISLAVSMPQFPNLGAGVSFIKPKRVHVFVKVCGVPAKPTDGLLIYLSKMQFE